MYSIYVSSVFVERIDERVHLYLVAALLSSLNSAHDTKHPQKFQNNPFPQIAHTLLWTPSTGESSKIPVTSDLANNVHREKENATKQKKKSKMDSISRGSIKLQL